MNDDRLYGLDYWEHLYDDLASAWETWRSEYAGESCSCPLHDGDDSLHGVVVEISEFDVVSPCEHMPTADQVLEWIGDWIADNGEGDEGLSEDIDRAMGHPVVKATADRLLAAIAKRVSYRMANNEVARHRITHDVDGEPWLDGKPLYGPVVAP